MQLTIVRIDMASKLKRTWQGNNCTDGWMSGWLASKVLKEAEASIFEY